MNRLFVSRFLIAASTLFLAGYAVSGFAAVVVLMVAGGLVAGGYGLLSNSSRVVSSWRVSLFSGVLLAGMNFCGVNAITRLPLVMVAVLSLLSPIFSMLLAPLYRQPVHRYFAVLLALGMASLLALALYTKAGSVAASLNGIGFAAAGGILTAVWTNEQTRHSAAANPALHTGVAMLFGGTLMIPVMLITSEGTLGFLGGVQVWGVAAAGACLGAANTLITTAVQTVPATVSLLLKPLSSILTALGGVVLFGDPMNGWLLVSFMFAVALSGYASRKQLSSR